MASGPEHYLRAVRLLEGLDQIAGEATNAAVDISVAENAELRAMVNTALATAQVHATLSLAAATALGADSNELPADDVRAWMAACSLHKRSGESE